MHCFMISICGAEFEFDDGTNESEYIIMRNLNN